MLVLFVVSEMLYIITQLIYLSTHIGFADCRWSVKKILLDLSNNDQITFTLLPCFYGKILLFILAVHDIN